MIMLVSIPIPGASKSHKRACGQCVPISDASKRKHDDRRAAPVQLFVVSNMLSYIARCDNGTLLMVMFSPSSSSSSSSSSPWCWWWWRWWWWCGGVVWWWLLLLLLLSLLASPRHRDSRRLLRQLELGTARLEGLRHAVRRRPVPLLDQLHEGGRLRALLDAANVRLRRHPTCDLRGHATSASYATATMTIRVIILPSFVC